MTLSNWKGAWDHRSPQRRQRAKAGSTLQGPATAATAGGELSSRRHETVSHEAEAIRDAPITAAAAPRRWRRASRSWSKARARTIVTNG